MPNRHFVSDRRACGDCLTASRLSDLAVLIFRGSEVHALCEDQNVCFVLGQNGNAKLLRSAQSLID